MTVIQDGKSKGGSEDLDKLYEQVKEELAQVINEIY
jgi:hypothetical protein